MNLWFRLIRILLFSRFGKKRGLVQEATTRFRVSLTDLDVFFHMNNGRYLTLQDLGRLDFSLRTGFVAAMKKKKWYPTVAGEMIRFKKPLRLFQPFEIKTRFVGNDERYLYLEQKFFSKGSLVAFSLVKASILSKAGEKVSPADVLAAMDWSGEGSDVPDYVQQWQEAEQSQAASHQLYATAEN